MSKEGAVEPYFRWLRLEAQFLAVTEVAYLGWTGVGRCFFFNGVLRVVKS